MKAPFNGVCKLCGGSFESRYPKKYCSMKCYTSDPVTIKRLRDMNKKKKKERSVVTYCLNCEKRHIDKASRKRKFCNRTCMREYFDKRFDRYIASPVTFEKMQCFDEFLNQEELECLVDGCEWVGKNLSMHMNVAHGLPAQEFKKLAGFGMRTGVVSKPLRESLEAMDHTDRIALLDSYRPHIDPNQNRKKHLSEEGKERRAKAVALKKSEEFEMTKVCQQCGSEFTIHNRYGTRKKFCSIRCRNRRRYIERKRLTCCYCGGEFDGNYYQKRRSKKGLPVTCSLECRGRANARHPRK